VPGETGRLVLEPCLDEVVVKESGRRNWSRGSWWSGPRVYLDDREDEDEGREVMAGERRDGQEDCRDLSS
jgi:hypothetical protein